MFSKYTKAVWLQITNNRKRPDRFSKSVGVTLCLLHIILSVGAFCERPRANAVRPYRVLGKYFVISPLRTSPLGVAAIKQIYKIYKITATSDQTVTRGGVSLFFNKRRISDM